MVHFYGFEQNRNIPGPSAGTTMPAPPPLLYNYDPTIPGFTDFSSNPNGIGPIFTLDIMDGATGLTPLISNIPSDQEVIYSNTTPLSVRLKFTSVAAVPWHLSDYLLLTG
jgi:hypothetical protein